MWMETCGDPLIFHSIHFLAVFQACDVPSRCGPQLPKSDSCSMIWYKPLCLVFTHQWSKPCLNNRLYLDRYVDGDLRGSIYFPQHTFFDCVSGLQSAIKIWGVATNLWPLLYDIDMIQAIAYFLHTNNVNLASTMKWFASRLVEIHLFFHTVYCVVVFQSHKEQIM